MFLTTFFTTVFPEYSSNPLYVFGESYAVRFRSLSLLIKKKGKYIPSLAYYIYQANSASSKTITLNLQGIGIGDGTFYFVLC